MTHPVQHLRFRAAAMAVLIAIVGGPALAGEANAQFKAESDAAMDRMMAAMAIRPSGDVDRDFAQMMIPHHQGAIAMAQAELRHGKNEQLRRIAQEIIVDQQQEIAAMRLALGAPPPQPESAPAQPPKAAPSGSPPHASHTEHRP